MASPEQIKAQVSQAYAERLKGTAGCCTEADSGDGKVLYQIGVVNQMPEGVVSFGCGNPVALASLRPGEAVLDLGSGAGLDCFLAARQVGAAGSVIGVDFTRAMIDRAQVNAAKLGAANVSFRLGDIETLPLPDATVDVVISNCVINLAPDKDAVFREAFRVLRPGGRLMVSDIVLTRPATSEEMNDMALLAGCISGSLPVEEYTNKIRAAGFQNVHLDTEQEPREGQFWFSAAISALKPSDSPSGLPSRRGTPP